MKTLTAGAAAFIKLKEMVGELSRTPGELNDVFIELIRPAENLPCREIRRTKDSIIFIRYLNELSKYRGIPISDGDEFQYQIRTPASVGERRVTKFSDRLN